MKSVEEFRREWYKTHHDPNNAEVLLIQAYASHVLNEVAKKVEVIKMDITDDGFDYVEYIVDRQSILKLKEQL